jgi:carbamoyltransferase
VRLDGPLFELDLRYFTHHREGVEMTWDEGTPTIGRLYSDRLLEALGPAREQGGELTSEHENVAASLQQVLEEAYLRLVRRAWERTGSSNLCLAGGVALNAVANGRIRPETPFDGLYVQPAAGDSGIAVGAAYHVWNQEGNGPRGFEMVHAFTGPEYGDDEIVEALSEAGLEPRRLDDDALIAETAQRLADGEVVGWFQGRMEFGPRALGNRSIVVDPRRHDMKDILNARIKHREAFRPFAPSCLAERAGEYFVSDYPSPVMLLVFDVLPDKRAEVPAITHVDGTARVQTVSVDDNPLYYRMISEFEKLTGVPMVVNTSFNDNNEPIVASPQDAIACYLKTDVDALALGPFWVEKPRLEEE